MTTGTARFIGPDPRDWLLGRRYGVPASMVAAATQRRLAGDWRGACAAARIDVRIDVDRVRRRNGAEVLARLAEDLAHLVPDLLRWHLHDEGPERYRDPVPPVRGLLRAGRRVVLARYGKVALVATTPVQADGPQRIGLVCGKAGPSAHEWTRARYLWDSRQTPGLLHRMGGGDRVPFFQRDGSPRTRAELAMPAGDPVAQTERVLALLDAGQVHEAWRAAGVDADGIALAQPPWPIGYSATVPVIVRELRAHLAAPDAPDAVLLGSAVAVRLIDGELRAASWRYVRSQRYLILPQILWCRMPDLELLRTGQITAAELHPLVRAALFPDQPDPGYRPRPRPLGAAVSTVECNDIEVACSGRTHRIGFRGGRITAFDHTPQEISRERALGGLGGPAAVCVSALDAWSQTPRPATYGQPAWDGLPAELALLRAHAMHALYLGDTDELIRLLDGGIDPHGIRDHHGGALHRLASVDGLRILGRLLAAGLDVNELAESGNTPLRRALVDEAPDDLIRAMLAAGAAVGPHQPRLAIRRRLEAIAAGTALPAGTGSPGRPPRG